MIFRVIWRFISPSPPYPDTMKPIEKRLAHLSDYTLYLVIFLLIFGGWAMSALGGHTTYFWGWFDVTLPLPLNKDLEHIGETIHLILAWVIVGLLIMHVGAALMHHFVKKDNILRRMLP